MPSYWLVKTEPEVFSLDDLRRAPRQTTRWDGVRNFAARGHLRAMKKGDLVFVYHSNAKPSAVVGIAEVVKEAYPDPSQFDRKDEMGYDPKAKRDAPTWVTVDVRFREALPRPVALDEVKRTPALRKMALVRIARLSVQPVTAAEWNAALALARKKPPA
ncbi:MAG TPA: EVE domain-containing protein [Candidatus Thermoplasmatota archaeon]|nr:EVE domain-containing protein [Candidatus Thermoplasmatota archaeon]